MDIFNVILFLSLVWLLNLRRKKIFLAKQVRSRFVKIDKELGGPVYAIAGTQVGDQGFFYRKSWRVLKEAAAWSDETIKKKLLYDYHVCEQSAIQCEW